MISGIPRSIRCNGARLHPEQEGFRQSPGVDYTLTVIRAEQVLPIIQENFGQLISRLRGSVRAKRHFRKAAAPPFAALARLCDGGVRGIKQTANSKRIYFCCQRSGAERNI